MADKYQYDWRQDKSLFQAPGGVDSPSTPFGQQQQQLGLTVVKQIEKRA
ncbi:hypothetical protein TrispH2_010108 [Trichoplax sp. H2]|nr:hypothetical protein TrispH2_010108 [Trichoplax sp. H2]|eukprot:RDD39056.1 hypothetical protein TrispH2_010108 [Trichoplax sp. H2]